MKLAVGRHRHGGRGLFRAGLDRDSVHPVCINDRCPHKTVPEAYSYSHIGSIAPERLATPAWPIALSNDQACCVLQILLALLYLYLVARLIFCAD